MRKVAAFLSTLVLMALAILSVPALAVPLVFIGLTAAFATLPQDAGCLAATAGSFTNLRDALKRRYDDGFFGRVGWSKGKLAAMIAKKAWDGELLAYMMQVGNSPARSATFSTAKTVSEDTTYGFTKVKQPQVPWVSDYARATVAGIVMRAANSSSGTAKAYDKMVAQIDGINDAIMHSFSTKVYRDGFGSIGKIGATTNVATAALVLDVAEDCDLFEVGMRVQFSSSNAGATLRNSGGELIVIQNPLTGTLTMSAAINTNTGTIAGDFIFASGDRQNSATPTALALQGLDAWGPTAAPTAAENFNNLGDRNNDGRLLFNVIDTTTGTYSGANEEEALIAAVTVADRHGGKPRYAFFNPTRYQNLIKLGQGRFRPTTVEGPYGIGFSGVTVATPYGAEVKVFSDTYCPRKRAYTVDLDTLGFYGVGTAAVPSFLDHDGNRILRQTDDDGVECRVGYYGAVGCNAPVHNSVIKLES